jgi:hypothetical protein
MSFSLSRLVLVCASGCVGGGGAVQSVVHSAKLQRHKQISEIPLFITCPHLTLLLQRGRSDCQDYQILSDATRTNVAEDSALIYLLLVHLEHTSSIR